MKPKVVVGMSGGLDSSVAALLLQQMGYEVIGLFLHLYPGNHPRSCCSLDAAQYARRTAEMLEIPLYVYNAHQTFHHNVIRYFQEGYGRGKTPNPCIACNRLVRFPLFLQQAQALGADFIATGHYARIRMNPENHQYGLYRALDSQKDQSYFLYPVSRDLLSRLIFPLGRMTKKEVKEIALRHQLPSLQKPESQDLCFFMGNVAEFFPEGGVQIISEEGKTLGEYRGRLFFTIGQRKGLALSGGQKLYVQEVNLEKGFIRMGTRESLECSFLEVEGVNWLIPEPGEELEVSVQHRYHSEEVPAKVIWKDNTACVYLKQKIWAPAVGQSAVFYKDGQVLGGGIISRVAR
ncbi:MAG: tRNA 2-thiouridine(34) synthase MnmA [bacterium JZ-2024 1]